MTAAQLRARVLAEWRGLPQPPAVKDRTKTAGEVVALVMRELGLEDRLREEEVTRCWKEIVGEYVGSHSSPRRLTQGVLTVSVLQPTLRYELDRVWKKNILGKLQERMGKRVVREVKFQIG